MSTNNQAFPILYSLQNCPYALRARFMLFKCKQRVLIRAVKLNNKPLEMLERSPKGSVPILVLGEKLVIEESLELMLWSLSENDPDNLLHIEQPIFVVEMVNFIHDFETTFIPALEAYCCAKRYHENNIDDCRLQCEVTLKALEKRLTTHRYLFSENESLVDIALFPFLRKFAHVERQWYLQSPYPNLRQWLNSYLQSPTFTKVMEKHELWLENRKDIFFAG